MKPLILSAKEEDEENKIPPCLKVNTMSGKYFCTIRADGTVLPNPDFEYSTDELEQISGIFEHFFTIYNSFLEKDKLIKRLREENNELIKGLVYNINPVNSRQ